MAFASDCRLFVDILAGEEEEEEEPEDRSGICRGIREQIDFVPCVFVLAAGFFLCVFFVSLQVTGRSSPARVRRSRSAALFTVHRRRVEPRATTTGGAWTDAPPPLQPLPPMSTTVHELSFVISFMFMCLFEFSLYFNYYL